MTADPPRLLGTYRAPVFSYGATAFSEVRGECAIVSLSQGSIPWPIGNRGRRGLAAGTARSPGGR